MTLALDEIAFVALAGTLIAFFLSIVANLVSNRINMPFGPLVIVASVLLLSAAAVAIYPQMQGRTPDTGSDDNHPQTSLQPTAADGTDHDARSAPPGTSPPNSSTTSRPGPASQSRRPSTSKASLPAEDEGHTVTARSETGKYANNLPPAKTRFWAYGSGGVVGDLRFSEGGYAGRYGWAPVGIGRDCTVPYVRFIFAGIPPGKYTISAHIPDVPDLANQVEIGDWVINQAKHRNQWLELGSTTITPYSDGGVYIDLHMSQAPESFGNETGCRVGDKRVAFDAVRIRPIN
ncbi:hypothetical protein [Micromonospora gifhornensis]|uniref:hypothetical protein n=1 Tax=Micromonospora gifhornensis TaxID=84594 RepID=UPI003D73CC1C